MINKLLLVRQLVSLKVSEFLAILVMVHVQALVAYKRWILNVFRTAGNHE